MYLFLHDLILQDFVTIVSHFAWYPPLGYCQKDWLCLFYYSLRIWLFHTWIKNTFGIGRVGPTTWRKIIIVIIKIKKFGGISHIGLSIFILFFKKMEMLIGPHKIVLGWARPFKRTHKVRALFILKSPILGFDRAPIFWMPFFFIFY